VTTKDIEERMGPSDWIEAARQYTVEVRNELRKVTWPTRKEAVGGTIGVIVIVGVITLVLGLVDVTLAKVVEWILP
jgi:preprotein translocase subunit SecE